MEKKKVDMTVVELVDGMVVSKAVMRAVEKAGCLAAELVDMLDASWVAMRVARMVEMKAVSMVATMVATMVVKKAERMAASMVA